MMSMWIDVYLYNATQSFSLYCGGYNYTGNSWRNEFVRLIGSTASDNRVRFGHDGTKCCIVIGETSSSWPYPKINVRDFKAGHNSSSINTWDDGWTISIVSDLAGYTFTGDFPDALIDASAIKDQGDLATQDRSNLDYTDGADVTASKPQDLDWLIGTTGSLGIVSGGELLLQGNWTSSTGMQIDSNAETVIMGGSQVNAAGDYAGIFLGKDSAKYKFFVGSPTSYMKYDPTKGLEVLGNIVNLQMFAVSNWTQRTSSFGTTAILSIAHNGSNLWVAVGNSGKLATSSDGIDWTQRTSNFGTSYIFGIAHNGSNLWVAVGSSGKLATSSNGIDWTQRTSSFGTDYIWGIAYDGSGLWVAVGGSGKLATSSNGIDWTQRTSSFGTSWTSDLRDIAYNDSDLWVVVGYSGNLATSMFWSGE